MQSSKPKLLGGETGIGKTTVVSSLAKLLGTSLSLSNQSEASDLLEGFKPLDSAEDRKLHSNQLVDGFLKAKQKADSIESSNKCAPNFKSDSSETSHPFQRRWPRFDFHSCPAIRSHADQARICHAYVQRKTDGQEQAWHRGTSSEWRVGPSIRRFPIRAGVVPPKKNSPPEESDLYAREAAAEFGDVFLSPSPKANCFKPASSGPSAVNESFGAVRLTPLVLVISQT